ncbi:MAG TPA: PAS domain S-box protein [Terriglobales bacterium]|nr:PAS domain S-box protein [Terriglobales bacterium]
MDPQRLKGDAESHLSRLDREETKLWRFALFFIGLLGIGLAAAVWDNISQISARFGIIPIGAALFAVILAYSAGRKRREIAGLRQEIQANHKPPAKTENDDIEKLVDIIRRSQRGFRELVDSFDDVVLAISCDGTIQAANRTFADILGLGFADFVYHPIGDFVQSPNAADVERMLPRILSRNQWTGTVEVRFRHDPQQRYFDCSIRTIHKDGEVTGYSIWGRDVTHQREREARFTDLFETLHEGVYFTTPDGRLLDANQALVHMLGFETKSELQAIHIQDLYVDPSERSKALSELNGSANMQDREIKLRRRDGSEITCLDSSRAIYDAEGHVMRYQGTLVNITLRRQMEAQLLEQQQFNHRLIESFPDVIVVLDKDLSFSFVSTRMREILGLEPEELVGKPVSFRTEMAEPFRLYRDILSGAERIGAVEFSAQHRNGEWRTIRCTASALRGADGSTVGVVASMRDVTMSKQMEQQLVQAERLAAMGQMIDGFAHELNNPLTAIMGAVDLLDGIEHEGSKKHVRLLKEQVRRAVEIVQNLLFFSRPPARGTSRLNLNDLIQRTLLLHQYSLRVNGITVDFLPEPSIPLFEGDANQLMQVFLNLVINAEQAIRSVRERGSVRVRLGRSEGKIWVSFQDDGPGVPEGTLRNIFDPFYSTKRPGGGTGMGLSVALGIVKSYGGDIDFQAAPGGGAVFTVSLPMRAPTPAELASVATMN